MRIEVDIASQRLSLFDHGRRLAEYRVSTAANGVGEVNGSGMTPRGRHRVRAKIGAGLPPGAVLSARRWTGEIWTPQLHARHPGRDWILSRILWLCGCERGRNRLGCVDSFRRYIYLHGTPYADQLGTPASKGCVRMSNEDIIELYERIAPGTEVDIND
ncbi:MAG: L,D-transpeptidase family protein [Sinimarinibacterium flocculans]|uniref:L,D-transpeptidase family protein n=1 Tax=Sinimarinibacterium flocculans TaxID=985250 RepID=UPI003C37CB32